MMDRIKTTKPVITIHLSHEPTVSSEGTFYFLEYLEYKLFRFNMDSSVRFDRAVDGTSTEVTECYQRTSERVQEICGLLEHLYPKLFTHISRQHIKVDLRNEVIICDVFRIFCRGLFKRGISWPRIVALFAFAGGVVIDCIKERRAEFAKTVVYCMKEFMEDNLACWITDHGGWHNISEHFQDTRKVPKWYDNITSAVWYLVKFVKS